MLFAAAALVSGCGSQSVPGGSSALRLSLPGWRAVADERGIGELVPDLAGLALRTRTDSPALVHAGDVVRVTAFRFATPSDAATALARGRVPGYLRQLEKSFRGELVRTTSAPGRLGYRLTVPRRAESGADAAELYLLRDGRTLALVELVSSTGFDARLRERVLALVSR